MAFIATAAIVGTGISAAGGIAKLGKSLAGRKARKAEQLILQVLEMQVD